MANKDAAIQKVAQGLKKVFDNEVVDFERGFSDPGFQQIIGSQIAGMTEQLKMDTEDGREIVKATGCLCKEDDRNLNLNEFNKNAGNAYDREISKRGKNTNKSRSI